MASSPLFTAAIICYNRADIVRESIESVLRQECRDFELVLVDDASTDGSADILREYADRGTVIVRDKNGGEMAARNSAMAASHGEYVCFLDSDDQWFPWTLATYARAIEKHGRPTVVGGAIFEFQDTAQVGHVQQGPDAVSSTTCYLSSSNYLGVVAAAIRRSAIESVGHFVDLRYNGMDIDLMFRIGSQPGFVKIESPYTFAYRHHGGNIMGNIELRYRGALQWIQSEREGKYPGGAPLRAERLRHITLHARAISVLCLSKGNYRAAFDLYRRMFCWNVELGRWGYLATFPLMAACPPLIGARDDYLRRRRLRRKQSKSSPAVVEPSS
jgi:glycosyltransferase involved in cell wall biosynthesis